jgi:hypothetical protein
MDNIERFLYFFYKLFLIWKGQLKYVFSVLLTISFDLSSSLSPSIPLPSLSSTTAAIINTIHY